jgi:CRP-like cAMP-binding protein
MSSPDRNTFQNRLLAAFPPEDVRRFFSNILPVSFPLWHVLYDVDAPLEHVYFIEQGLSSILMSMSNGSTIEVGMIGLEGMIGIQAPRRPDIEPPVHCAGSDNRAAHEHRSVQGGI